MKKTWFGLLLVAVCFASTLASPLERVTPELRLSCDPPAFSPNGDRVKDQTFFQPFLNVQDQVNKWEMTIRSRSGKVVKKTNGYDGLPALLVWDGLDQKGQRVKEGAYVAKLAISTRGSGKLSASTDVVLVLTPPALAVQVSTPSFSPGSEGDEGRITFAFRYQGLTGADRWELSIQQEGGAPLQVWRSTGILPETVVWDGRDENRHTAAPPGRYIVKLSAWDLAGNTGQASPASFTVNPEALSSVIASLKHIRVNQSAWGMEVWLSASDLFVEDGLDPPLTPAAPDFLAELAYLIQTYPDSVCSIEGFSHHRKLFDDDVTLSSSWAWRIYSVLVKSGVSAKRLDVRGLGRQIGPSDAANGFEGVVVTLKK